MTLNVTSRHLPEGIQTATTALLVAICYYFSARFGLILSFKPDFIAALWPPNAVLLASLLLTPPKKWIYYLLAVVPAELAADIPAGISWPMALGFVGADWIEVLTAAALIGKVSAGPIGFDNLRQIIFFILFAVVVGPFVAAFPGALVTGIGQDGPLFWIRWQRWFTSDTLTHLIITPFILLWVPFPLTIKAFRRPVLFYTELILLIVFLVLTGITVLGGVVVDMNSLPALLYAPLPGLLWAAIRFGPRGVFSASLFITLISIWHASHGQGPFISHSPAENVLQLQVFLLVALTPLLILAVIIDERRQAEIALRESEARYSDLYEHAPDMYVTVDTRTADIVECNQTTADRFGYKKEDLIGRRIFDLFHPDSRMDAEKVFHSFRTTGDVRNAELKFQGKGGAIIHVILNATVARDQDGAPCHGRAIFRDITERKQLEEYVYQSQKMDAISSLAGGISHQFNNALTVMAGNLALLSIDLPDLEVFSNYLNPMKLTIQRLSELTSQLLAYAEGGRYMPKTISLSDVVKNNLLLVRNTIPADIDLETDLPQDIWPVYADVTQIQMVMSAILINAAEAIENKGRIQIVCRNETLSNEKTTDFTGFKTGRFVSLAIEDDGRGMDGETRRRIFEPFFTTKITGRGLGMAAVYGIVRNHDGWISVDTDVHAGTTVRIYLPAIEDAQPIRAESKEEEAPAQGSGTVLLIEDEAFVMNVSRSFLERTGYRVLEATTGQEAIQIARDHEGQIDLALLDIKLPDMEGSRIYPLIKKARPKMKVIVCSGYAVEGPVREILNLGADGFLQKPFSFQNFSLKIKEILEA